MKKYIYGLFSVLLAIATMTSCVEEEGTEPGHDSAPAVTVYKYTVSKPLNADNDVRLRFAFNNRTTDAFYLVEKTADKNARITSGGEAAYNDYVVSNGVKLAGISADEPNADVTLTDLYGDYTITAVAVGGATKTSASIGFVGLDWETKATGTYRFTTRTAVTGTSRPTTLQICTTNSKLYRFKDVWGVGYHMKINLIDQKGVDEDGEYTFFRISAQETPFTYSTYGSVYIRDIGYWQGSDAWITTNGYESGMYSDYSCFIYPQYYVYTSATTTGSLGYTYEFFIPD